MYDNHKWHADDERWSILCYLVFPKSYESSSINTLAPFTGSDHYAADLRAVLPMFLESPSSEEYAKQAKQFRLAMAALGLDPHTSDPAQSVCTSSVDGDEVRSNASEANTHDDGEKPVGNIDTSGSPCTDQCAPTAMDTWPRLIQLVDAKLTL